MRNARPTRPSGDADATTNRGELGQDSAQLSRALILDSAIAFIDHHGLAALTMRRLGAACGVEAMALYRYVHSRGDLLTGVVDHIIDQHHTDHLAARRGDDGWQDYLVRLAHGTRQIALDHPQVFPLIATEPPAAPWLRPPLRSLRWLETFLDTLMSYGFNDDAAVTAYRSYTTFLLGHLLLDASSRGAHTHPDDVPLDEDANPPATDLADYPHLHRLHTKLAHDDSTTEFEESLEALLDRLELRLTTPT